MMKNVYIAVASSLPCCGAMWCSNILEESTASIFSMSRLVQWHTLFIWASLVN